MILGVLLEVTIDESIYKVFYKKVQTSSKGRQWYASRFDTITKTYTKVSYNNTLAEQTIQIGVKTSASRSKIKCLIDLAIETRKVVSMFKVEV